MHSILPNKMKKTEYTCILDMLVSLGLKYASISQHTSKYQVKFGDEFNTRRCRKQTTTLFGLIHRKFIVNGQKFVFKYCSDNVFYITPIS